MGGFEPPQLLPPPPQGGVSTIPPHPHFPLNWDWKYKIRLLKDSKNCIYKLTN